MTNEKTISIELTRTEANALMVMLDSEMEATFEFDDRAICLDDWENLDLAAYKILAFHKYKTWYMENCGE